ncbi:putative transcription initiation factor TFIID subunit 2 [Halenospora varia]|nr:putative transcription initiation factor TFIID subunit 2 [Halenospora varia]
MVIHDLHPRQPVVDPEGMQIAAPIEEPNIPDYKFVLSHQKVELDIDFSTQSLTGKVELTILPQTKELSVIKIDARQCSIPRGKVLVNGVVADFDFEDPMEALSIPDHLLWGANQYDLQRERIKHLAEDTRSRGTLEITLPRGVRVEEVDPFSENPATQRALAAARASVVDGISGPLSATPANTPKTAAEQAGRFQPLTITIPFIIKHFRDGLHFIGLAEGDARFPYAYTRHSVDPGLASCIFPCIDDPAMRCTWDITIKCSRTLGDALKKKPLPVRNNPHKPSHHGRGLVNGIVNGVKPVEEYQVPLSEEEKLLEMVVVCSGEVMNESMDIEDGTKKIQSFQVSRIVAARHIGFAIGPFEQVDLSEYREDEDGEKLGQGQALQLLGYCLPGRADEVRHSCSPLAHAVDHFTLSFGSYPFSQYSLVFVDDQIRDVEHTASLSLCSTRILYGEDIIDPEIESIRTLVHAIASQWFGVSIVPEERSDRWITIGLSHYMTALYMKHLCGNNEYLFRQKTLSDKLVKLDVDRPSLFSLGETLHLGQFEMEFMELKAPLVLFILDKRIIKASASPGLTRVLAKLVMAANTGQAEESLVSTVGFRRFVEKVTKYRQTEPFWSQWVFGAGCPILNISQKFNKKRNSVEMTISQKQDTIATQRPLKKGSFMREMKEELHGIYAGELQPVFTGPLTIRIHEADGTPYEHIVEIREGVQKIEIPYNTKYKRLKRNKRHKERVNVAPGDHGEGGEDALYYCLGDVLQTPADYAQWQLFDWDRDTEKKMDEESYEWLRVDADFEWLCEKAFTSMPSYMYVSQLQQDRDVVAQQESMKFLTQQSAHPLASTFCVRTLMDSRYFHGIRTMAVQALASHGIAETDYTGSRQLEKVYQELFCYRGTKTSRPNDFSDKRTYWVECEIPKAMAQMRNEDGYCHRDARHFILDMLRFNDNVSNEYSDYHKISILLSALAQSLVKGEPSKPAPRASAPTEDMTIQDPQERTNDLQRRVAAHVKQQDDLVQKRQEYRESDRQDYPQFKVAALEEIERYRRMDEWVNSYQNIYTTTVLDCKRLLMKEKVTPLEPLDFAQYLHDGTADLVRIKAFECLIDLGFITHKAVASLLLNLLSTDSSPYVRSHLFEVFCLGLAGVAFGENKNPDAAPGATNGEVDLMADGAEADALIVQDASTEARKAQILRTTSIEGALAALKEDLKTDEVLKDALWTAIKSTEIGVSEQQDLLDICSILYDAVESMIVKLRLPRFWGVRKGDRKVRGILFILCNVCANV